MTDESKTTEAPSDHHVLEDGTVFRTDRQKELLAELETSARPDRTPTGDEDGRLRARKLREPATFIADQQRLHEIARLDDPTPEPPEPKPEVEGPAETLHEGEDATSRAAADTLPPPTPAGEGEVVAHPEHPANDPEPTHD